MSMGRKRMSRVSRCYRLSNLKPRRQPRQNTALGDGRAFNHPQEEAVMSLVAGEAVLEQWHDYDLSHLPERMDHARTGH
ncbi:hypothetical protein UPYG_G00171560 [Umbra pygmaea]|uniref:Uncharacterized protein n=1 Tax=Umbra pygmaea TaxID=75934 RepID=A0ABD0WP40_UMBPY